ncbi:MAG: hypothetical protein M5R42_09420 [Rhodocyclaceae bacterium]|nr:hypothetical protein [Rhodocyclaceae bacterium]
MALETWTPGRSALKFDQFAGLHARIQGGDHVAPIGAREEPALGCLIRIPHLDAHQESVKSCDSGSGKVPI